MWRCDLQRTLKSRNKKKQKDQVKRRKSHNSCGLPSSFNDLGAWPSCYYTLNVSGCDLEQGQHVSTSWSFAFKVFAEREREKYCYNICILHYISMYYLTE